MQCAVPIEIVEDIIDCNKYDPPTLWSCALVCRKWAHRSSEHLKRKPTLTIRSVVHLHLIGRLLVSKRSRGLYGKVELLHVVDNPSKPFAHTLPYIVHGRFLPELTTVVLEGMNWTDARPHVDFFKRLSSFSSATSLCIHRCFLRPAAHVLRIVRGLPGLKRATGMARRFYKGVGRERAVQLDHVLIGEESEHHRDIHAEKQHQTLQTGEPKVLRYKEPCVAVS